MFNQPAPEYTQLLPFALPIFEREKKRVDKQNRKSQHRGLIADLTLKRWLQTLTRFNWKCAYCSAGQYEVLHRVVQVTHGGGSTRLNCVPACKECAEKRVHFAQRDAQIVAALASLA